jgi:hypothetical protein
MEENMLQQSASFTARKLGILLLTLCVAGLGTTLLSRAGAPEHETAPAGTTISSDITTDTTWTLAGSPYSVTKLDLYINSGVTLTIEPGVEVLLMDRAKIHVSGGASLIAKGTPSQHISITRVDTSSRWKYIQHYPGSTSYYRYVDFTWGGKDTGSLYYQGPGTHTLNSCVIDNTKRNGIYATGSGLNLRIAGVLITNYENFALSLDDGAAIQMTGSEVLHTEQKHGIYVRKVGAASVLTITSSSIIVPHPNTGIYNEFSSSVCVSAQDNWWGDSSGPMGGGGGACSLVGSNSGSGTGLTLGVDWRNYRTTATSRVGITTTPVVSFTVSPDPSTAQPPGTNYTFDGSVSTDAEDYASSLDFCWDWEDNGSCDETDMTTMHSYASGGWHTARLTVTDTDNLTDTVTQNILSGWAPTATFIITQTSWSEFQFDASGSSDVETTDKALLQAYWDWEGDEVLDTGPYSVTHVLTHSYSHIGRYWPTVSVVDTDTVTGTYSLQVDVIPPAASTTIGGGVGTLVSADGTVTVTVAGGVISDGAVITHTPWITVPNGALPGDFTYQGFNLSAESGGLPIGSASGPFTITVAYDLDYYGNVLDLWASESLLRLYRWDSGGGEWVLVPSAIVSGQLEATTDSFGDFALVLEAQKVYLPLVLQSY